MTEFRMPILSADMDAGVLTRWLVAPGDHLSRGDIVAVVGTDKSDIDVEVFHEGIVDELLVEEGARVPVGTPIARIAAAETPASTSEATDGHPPPRPPATETHPVSRMTSPVLRRLAQDQGVDATRVRGSGPGGRVTRDDIVKKDTSPGGRHHDAARHRPIHRADSSGPTGSRAAITPRARRLAIEAGRNPLDFVSSDQPVTASMVLAEIASAPRMGSSQPGAPEETPSERGHLAALMTRSWRDIPHFHVTRRVDLTAMVAEIARYNDARRPGDRLLAVAVLLWATAQAARDVDVVNGWWEAERHRTHPVVDLGIVVARRNRGLTVVTVPHAETATPADMMQSLDAAVERVRRRRLRSRDVAPASLTVTAMGDLGADMVSGVIHPPQVALIGLGRIHDAAMVRAGEITSAPVIDVTVAGDHRALDGLDAARFLERFVHHLDHLDLDSTTARIP